MISIPVKVVDCGDFFITKVIGQPEFIQTPREHQAEYEEQLIAEMEAVGYTPHFERHDVED